MTSTHGFLSNFNFAFSMRKLKLKNKIVSGYHKLMTVLPNRDDWNHNENEPKCAQFLCWCRSFHWAFKTIHVVNGVDTFELWSNYECNDLIIELSLTFKNSLMGPGTRGDKSRGTLPSIRISNLATGVIYFGIFIYEINN